MKFISTIVIDPQVGFCARSGSLGRMHGCDELSKIEEIIPNIKSALKESHRRHLVFSHYTVGQFTNGDAEHPLAKICVPQENDDCDIIDELSAIDYHSSVVKHQQSALSSQKFCEEIEGDLKRGIKHFVVTGFLLEHCVRVTAEELKSRLSACGAEVFVGSDLSASRSEKYKNGIVVAAAGALNSSGIRFEPWQKIRSQVDNI